MDEWLALLVPRAVLTSAVAPMSARQICVLLAVALAMATGQESAAVPSWLRITNSNGDFALFSGQVPRCQGCCTINQLRCRDLASSCAPFIASVRFRACGFSVGTGAFIFIAFVRLCSFGVGTCPREGYPGL